MGRRSNRRAGYTPASLPARRRPSPPARVPFQVLGIHRINVRLGNRGSPKASKPVIVRSNTTLRRTSSSSRTTLVTPTPALVVRMPSRKNRSALLGLPIHRKTSPKQAIKRLCKCTNKRSEAQRKVSRNFFKNGGSGGKLIQACQC